MTNHPHLLTLPPNLRNRTLSEALIDPDPNPLPAYLLRRTVRRKKTGEHITSTRRNALPSHCVETKVFPSIPPVLQTCRLLRLEGFPVWPGAGGGEGNVFLFLLGPGEVGTVEKWVDRSGFLGWVGGGGSTRRKFCFVCEFLMEDSWDEGDVGASVVTEWDFGQGSLELGFGGALVGDCTCDLVREGRRVSERLGGLDRDRTTGFHRLEMEGFFGFLEAEVRDVFTVMNRKMGEQGRLCQVCGKPRWQREWA